MQDALDLEFDVRRKSNVDADHARARQVAGQPRRREFRPLKEINAGLNPQRSGREHVNVFGQQWPLLSARR